MRFTLALLLTACGGAPAKRASYPDTSYGYGGETVAAEADYYSGGTGSEQYYVADATTAGTVNTPPPVPSTGAVAEPVVITGSIYLDVDEVGTVAEEVHEKTKALGGRIVYENVSGGVESSYGSMQVRIPPETVEPFLTWLDGKGTVTSRQLSGEDVSKQYFDQELALKSLRVTLDRLLELVATPGITMQEVLAIEAEINRVRSQIESIEGEHRFLQDRVSMATLNITLSRRGGAVFGPKAKFHPGPRGSVLILIDPGMRERMRFGAGVTLHFDRAFTMELDIYPEVSGEGRAVVATLGGSAYSDFLGAGRRTFLNPFIGFRAGYGHLPNADPTMDGNDYFLLSGEVGLELYKQKYLLVDTWVQALSFISEDFDAAVQVGAEVMIPF